MSDGASVPDRATHEPSPDGLGHSVSVPSAGPSWDIPCRILISTNSLAGELASWAVQQSPYDVPDGLEQAIKDFRAAWPHESDMAYFPCKYWDTYEDLRAALEAVFENTPSIEAWNHRKNGREGMGFSSRFDQPAPDDDFIDLWALSNNIARSVWKDGLEDVAFNEKFEAEWSADPNGENIP